MKKILLIRMLGLGDVTCVGIPAVRHLKKLFPDAEISMLTYAAAKDVVSLAEPDVKILHMQKGEWPDNILQAMEAFLGLSEKIIAEEYTQVINLDTWFMPCFLTRFLKDAGVAVTGNYMSISVADLLSEFQAQTLKPHYVNDPAAYMESTFFAMSRWHTPWWEIGAIPDMGYPEFYLRHCCGFSDIDMDMNIDVQPYKKFNNMRAHKQIIALATDARTKERNYPYGNELQSLLESKGYHVWTGFDGSVSMSKTLSMLKASDLLITVPSAPQWLAATVGCPSLVIVGEVDPRTLMPEYATEQSSVPISAEELANDVHELLNATRQ